MTVMRQIEQFAYGVGEEVVFGLTQAEAFDLDRGAPITPASMPAWTIGVIVARKREGGVPSYLVRFEHHRVPCLTLAGQHQIEGTA
ncbi:MAG: hypothetical protein M3P30_11445 [Chloroflexota bacterium]|nr:hypothetical protein [Chloroflexota bacterium]